jgi:hypothetical protein
VADARSALQSVRFACSTLGVATTGSSSRDWLLVQSCWPLAVPPLWVKRFHYAVGHFLGCVVFPQQTSLVTIKRPVESSLRVSPPWSITQSNLANRPQPINSSHGLWLPTAHQGSKVHLPRAYQPATFRLQGLATLLTACALRSRAGSVSHRRRSWDSPFGAFSSRKVSGILPPDEPTYRFACRCSRRGSVGPSQTGCGSWVSTLSRVPGVPAEV